MPRSIAFLILVLCFPITYSWSQEITGTFQGRILNEENSPVQAANVRVTSISLQGVSGTSSNEQGFFRFPALPVGYLRLLSAILPIKSSELKMYKLAWGGQPSWM